MANSVIKNPVENKVATINNVYNWLKPDYTTFNFPDKILITYTNKQTVNTVSKTAMAFLIYECMGTANVIINGSSIPCWQMLLTDVNSYTQSHTKTSIEKDLSIIYLRNDYKGGDLAQNKYYVKLSATWNGLAATWHSGTELSNKGITLNDSKQAAFIIKSFINPVYSGIEHAGLYIEGSQGSIVTNYINTSKKGITNTEYSNIFGLSSSDGKKCILQSNIYEHIKDNNITVLVADRMEPYNSGSNVNYTTPNGNVFPRVFPLHMSGLDAIVGKTIDFTYNKIKFIGEIGPGLTSGYNNVNYETGNYRFGNVHFKTGRGRVGNNGNNTGNQGQFKKYQVDRPKELCGCIYRGNNVSPVGCPVPIVDAPEKDSDGSIIAPKLSVSDSIYFGFYNSKPYLSPAIIKTGNTTSTVYNNILTYPSAEFARKVYRHPTLKNTLLNNIDGYEINNDAKGHAIIPIVEVPSGLNAEDCYVNKTDFGGQGDSYFDVYAMCRTGSTSVRRVSIVFVYTTIYLHFYKYAYGTNDLIKIKYSDYSTKEWNTILEYIRNNTTCYAVVSLSSGTNDFSPQTYNMDNYITFNSITRQGSDAVCEVKIYYAYDSYNEFHTEDKPTGSIGLYGGAAIVLVGDNEDIILGSYENNLKTNNKTLLCVRGMNILSDDISELGGLPTSYETYPKTTPYGRYHATYTNNLKNYILNTWNPDLN